MSYHREKIKIGQLLLQDQLITETQLEEALQIQKKQGGRIGEKLIEKGYIKEEVFLAWLAKQLNIPFTDLTQIDVQAEIAQNLPEAYARRFKAILLNLNVSSKSCLIGMVDPLDLAAIDQLKRVLNFKYPIEFSLVKEADLQRALNTIYRKTQAINTFAEALREELDLDVEKFELSRLGDQVGQIDAPVIRLIQSIFEDALQIGASDIHIEPLDKGLRIRLRVDGILRNQIMREKEIAPALAQRLKLMSSLNIAEKRLPQDGRFSLNAQGILVDVRLSTLSTPYGESVVMRLLNQSNSHFALNNLGMPTDILNAVHTMVQQPHGIFLVTGPTGSGKTTTLYAALQSLDSESLKIITIEDPIEYKLENLVQTQVHPKINLSFAEILRTALRQDPDVIMVGEIRDEETASIAIRAALTGHTVFSTLHTNNAAATAVRLLDMKIEGFLIASSLLGILAQRLIRKLCSFCKKITLLEDHEKIFVDSVLNEMQDITFNNININNNIYDSFYRGYGCDHCNKTGFAGRIGIYELLTFSLEMRDALRQNDSITFMQLARDNLKGKLLVHNAIREALRGQTTISEVMRVVGSATV